MVHNDDASDDASDLQKMLAALDDPDCRAILEHASEPMTANELTDMCDIPESTLYRKLELLSDASLVQELTELRRVGRHATRYERDFEEICIAFDDDELVAALERPPRSPEVRLVYLWSEMSEET